MKYVGIVHLLRCNVKVATLPKIQVRRLGRIHVEEPRWNYADGGEWHVIDQHLLTNRPGRIAETRLRESVT
jgi:hypothetical protein